MCSDTKEILEIMMNVALILGVIFSYMQIRKISSSVDIGKKANMINVLNYFTKEYDSLMMEAMECVTSKKVETWYLRFWNLFTNEFLFFSKGLLDPIVFEFWAFKACFYYNKRPAGIPFSKVDSYKKSHLKYIEKRKGSYPNADLFFKELMAISDEEKDRSKIEKRVHDLITRYKKNIK